MPKKQIIGSIFIIVLLSIVCIYIYDNFKVEKKTVLIASISNTDDVKEYYIDNKRGYYIYGLDSVVVDYTDRTLELSKALEAKQINIEEVLTYLKRQISLDNDKVVMYQNDSFSVVECRLDDGKTNYIFGKPDLEYKEGLCSNIPYLCSFTKTYYVLDISDIKNSDNKYVTLKNSQSEEVATIQIESKEASLLVEKNYYQFIFASMDKEIETDIKDIFGNNRILDIKLSTEDNQINNNICK